MFQVFKQILSMSDLQFDFVAFLKVISLRLIIKTSALFSIIASKLFMWKSKMQHCTYTKFYHVWSVYICICIYIYIYIYKNYFIFIITYKMLWFYYSWLKNSIYFYFGFDQDERNDTEELWLIVLYDCWNHSNLEMEAECLAKTLS